MENLDGFLPILIDAPIYLISEDNPYQKVSKKTAPKQDIKESSTPTTELKNNKDVIVVCSSTKEKEIDFLVKILSAVKISQKDAFFTDQDVPDDITSNAYIYFGRHSDSGIEEKYDVVQKGAKKILSADSLNELEQNVSKKKQLWGELQKMFS